MLSIADIEIKHTCKPLIFRKILDFQMLMDFSTDTYIFFFPLDSDEPQWGSNFWGKKITVNDQHK
jgi:hypothetical protein